MDEAQEILLSSLRSSGISLPPEISSIKDLTPDSIVSICAQFLFLLDDSILPFPSSLPPSTTDRFKICADLASAVKSSGYRGDISFNQFLYPSGEDLYNLVRFLVERLSESSERRKSALTEECKSKPDGGEASCNSSKGGKDQSNQAIPYSAISCVGSKDGSSVSSHSATGFVNSESIVKVSSCSKETEEDFSEDLRNSVEVLSFNGESVGQSENKFVSEPEQKLASPQFQFSKVKYEAEKLQHQEKMVMEANDAKCSEVQKLENEAELLRAAADMAFDDQHSIEFYIGELHEQAEAKAHNITELKSQRKALIQILEERKLTPGQSSHSLEPGMQEKLKQLKEIQLETESILSEIQKRELEHFKLLEELKKLPKLPPRKSYIQRITEITKNSWKQDADIDRILQDTRELQLESNSVQERLARTYAVVDETVFREAKKDAVGRQVYRLLTSIHDNFEQISEKILATDRAQREAAEHEAKLAVLSSRSLDIDKLQSDLDSIRKENDLLEQQLHQNSSTKSSN